MTERIGPLTFTEKLERDFLDAVEGDDGEEIIRRVCRVNNLAADFLHKLMDKNDNDAPVSVQKRFMLFAVNPDAELMHANRLFGKPLSSDSAKAHVIETTIVQPVTGALTFYNGIFGSVNEQKRSKLIEFLNALVSAAAGIAGSIKEESLRRDAEVKVRSMRDFVSTNLRGGHKLN